jgi:hypothetical protein
MQSCSRKSSAVLQFCSFAVLQFCSSAPWVLPAVIEIGPLRGLHSILPTPYSLLPTPYFFLTSHHSVTLSGVCSLSPVTRYSSLPLQLPLGSVHIQGHAPWRQVYRGCRKDQCRTQPGRGYFPYHIPCLQNEW